MGELLRRRLLAATATVGTVGLGGCLTLDPAVRADTGDSVVFEELSTSEPWASGYVRTSVSLADDATTSGGVGRLNVIGEDGTTFSSTALDAGQTSVTVSVPANTNATVVAVNTVNGSVVERLPVRTDGNRLV
ncbi:hypothetical protein BRC90_00670 [Halobacteriales archaeon QS_4_69_34]|nr:MAG: hypothetical protein BRC90_00670 [Halobacteriales archaeon QS_4_69_34]